MPLDFPTAERIARAALARAQELGLTPTVAIVDDVGNLKYFGRTDGAAAVTIQTSIGKALVASAFRKSSREMEERYMERPGFYAGLLSTGPFRAVYGPGALPIVMNGKVVGAIGVGGAHTADLEEEVARAGIAAVDA